MRAILTYHSIDDSGSVISVTAERFAEHVRFLASSGVRVLSVEDLLSHDDGSPAVAITFDDAFTNFATAAWPLLRDRGFPVTVFVPTGHVGATNRWSAIPGGDMPELPVMNWDALARLSEEGVELGAHTRTHADLRHLDPAAVRDEVAGSFDDIARATGRRPTGFAYPYGYFNEAVVRETERWSRWACTTLLGPLGSTVEAHRLPRLDAYFFRGRSALNAYGTGRFRAYIAVRAAIRQLRRR